MIRIKKYILVFFILSIAIFLFFYISQSRYSIDKTRNILRCPNCNVILISIDALRADHLGAYGYSINISPNIDQFANDGVLFLNAISQSSWTPPSHMSIMTSLYPSKHKIMFSDSRKLDDTKITLAEILNNNGYITGAFVSSYHLSDSLGFTKGFYLYDNGGFTRDASENILKSIDWISINRNRKFFLFLHLGNVHEADALQPKYDISINYTDYRLGELFKKLKEFDIDNKTLIIITSDHGEEILDHGETGHVTTLYDELIRVPLIVRGPNIPNKIILSQVESIDIMPTILDFLDINANISVDGKSLLYSMYTDFHYNDSFALSEVVFPDINTKFYAKTSYTNFTYIAMIPLLEIHHLRPRQTFFNVDIIMCTDKNDSIENCILKEAGIQNISLPQDIFQNKIMLSKNYLAYIVPCDGNFYYVRLRLTDNNFTYKPNDKLLNDARCLSYRDSINNEEGFTPFTLGNFTIKYPLQKEVSKYSIRTNKWKLICTIYDNNTSYELYDLENDPLELNNIVDTEPIVFYDLQEKLHNWINNVSKEYPQNNTLELDKDMLEKLRAAGY